MYTEVTHLIDFLTRCSPTVIPSDQRRPVSILRPYQLEQHIVQQHGLPHWQRTVNSIGATKPVHTSGGETSNGRTLLLQFLSDRLVRVSPAHSIPDERFNKGQRLQCAHTSLPY